MKSTERKVFLNEIKRLEDALAREREENRILKERLDGIGSYQSEYEKLIAEVKEELLAAKEMKGYFGKLKNGLEKELSELQ